MDKFYFDLVIAGVRTCNKENTSVTLVPAKHRDTVMAMLEKDGRDADGKKIA